MTRSEFDALYNRHNKWCNMWNNPSDDVGQLFIKYEDFSDMDFSGLNLQKAVFINCNFNRTVFGTVYLDNSTFRRCTFGNARFRNIDTSFADFGGSTFTKAVFSCSLFDFCSFRDTNLFETTFASDVNFFHSDFRCALMTREAQDKFIPMICPEEGAFIGWKSCGGYIVKLRIPEDARRSSGCGRKCRASWAYVLDIQHRDGSPADIKKVQSNYDPGMIYEVGRTVVADEFDGDRMIECSNGIHFFMTRDEAVRYGQP